MSRTLLLWAEVRDGRFSTTYPKVKLSASRTRFLLPKKCRTTWAPILPDARETYPLTTSTLEQLKGFLLVIMSA